MKYRRNAMIFGKEKKLCRLIVNYFCRRLLCGINHNSYKKRNWKEYNEHLIRRGETLFSFDFVEVK